ncbi:helix-turn-helix domain-containing protein [Corynebacterium sp. A21]|uniref:helix-turn-helix domain-containing protein n=1 Tax=Corynebacterium sp. A21 TaxID=3457318 RepID=UPI003FD589A8
MAVSPPFAWTHQMRESFGLELQGKPDQARGDVRKKSLGSVSAFKISGNPQSLQRTSGAITNAENTPLKVCAIRSGTMVLMRGGEADLRFQAGSIAFYDTGRPYRLRFEGQWDCTVMTVAREELTVPDRTLRNALRQKFSDPGPGTVLTQLLDLSIREEMTRGGSSVFLGNAAIDLLSGLAYEKDTPHVPEEALRVAIRSYIQDHLGNPDLDVAWVAGVHRISIRTLHRIFQDEDWGVAEMIRNLRLDAVKGDLLNPRLHNQSIMTVGARWGFQDQSHLTRLFRTRFGITPAAFRQEHTETSF